MCRQTCIYVYKYIQTLYACLQKYICMHICIHAGRHAWAHMCMDINRHITHTYIVMDECMYVHIYVNVYMLYGCIHLGIQIARHN